MKNLLLIIFTIVLTSPLGAQKHFTRSGNIIFSSDAPMEKIEASNSKASSVMDIESGAIEWAVLIKAFEFKKALMQDHFNENYMESSTYPKANFKGIITNIRDINFQADGNYEANIEGKITIHGVTKEISTTANFTIAEKIVSATSSLIVLVKDFNIKIPKLVKDNIAKEVSIMIDTTYQPLNR